MDTLSAPKTLMKPLQRYRGPSFRQEYQGGTKTKTAAGGRNRAPSMAHDQGASCLPPQAPEDKDKIVLVLDLDETLVFAREGPLYARPGLDEFFAACKGKCEVVVWTAGLRAYAQAIVKSIDKHKVVKHCVYRHAKWFSGQAGYRKDLACLGRDINKTIIIENTPDCIRGYQQNGILVEDYEGGERADHTIPALTEVVRQLVDSGKTVPEFITTCPMLQKGPVETDIGDYIMIYTLNVGLWQPGEHQRVNRDIGAKVI